MARLTPEQYARWRWLRALWWTRAAEWAIWWMLFALVLFALGQSPSVRLAFWFDVLTTLPACIIVSSLLLAHLAALPPPRGLLIACVVVEALSTLVVFIEVIVRASKFDCKGDPRCENYPERNLAVLGLALATILVLVHILALVFASIMLHHYESVSATHRDTSRGTTSSKSTNQKRKKTSRGPVGTEELMND